MSSRVTRRTVIRALAVGVPAAVALAELSSAEPAASPLRVRGVVRRFDAFPTRDGAGVKLRRAIGSNELSMLDPFVLLDEIHSDRVEDYIRGFPTHPHRGFETVTYMVEGAMEHKDSLGNGGRLGPGSAQWMTAGHGIVHSEMPRQVGGMMWGFQLWVNLPRADKMIRPRYQNIAPERIVEIARDTAHVRLVAGELAGKRGPVTGIVTAPQMMDVKLARGGSFAHALPPAHNAFVYVFDGAAEIGGTRVAAGQLAVLGPGDALAAGSGDGARFLLCAARPIREPVARSGPFVMNTQAELQQAWDDYRAGRLVLMNG